MQPVWICLLSGRRFEETFEHTHWRKSNKCRLCNFVSSYSNTLNRHLKTHSGGCQINATDVNKPSFRQAIWRGFWKYTVANSLKNAACVSTCKRAKSFLGGNTFSRFLIPQWMAMLNTPLEIDNHKIWQTYVYQTQVNLGPDLWVRMTVRHWCLVPPDDQTNPNCATWWPNIQLINIQLINTSGAIWWSIVQLMQVVPSGGQICNWCKWCHLVVKFATNTSGTIWLPNLQLMQVTESISGSVVPLAMFSILLWMHTWLSLNFHCCNQFWQIYIYLEGMGLQYPARVEIPCCG